MNRTSKPIDDRASWLEKRKRNINASDMAALFHAHPHKTALQLWAEQTGKLPFEALADNDVLRRGRIMEPAVAAALREDHPDWGIDPGDEYCELADMRIGCTPDFYACTPQDIMDTRRGFLIQAKTVLKGVFEAEWAPAPPAHYLIQVQTEMLVTGLDRCILAALVLDGWRYPVHEFEFRADPEFQQQILDAAARFWECVETGREPTLKPAQDGPTLARLHPDGQAEPVLALHGDAEFVASCVAYEAARADAKSAEERKAAAGCRLMAKMRNHAKAEALDYRVNWTTVPEVPVAAHVKKAHRRLSVNAVRRVK